MSPVRRELAPLLMLPAAIEATAPVPPTEVELPFPERLPAEIVTFEMLLTLLLTGESVFRTLWPTFPALTRSPPLPTFEKLIAATEPVALTDAALPLPERSPALTIPTLETGEKSLTTSWCTLPNRILSPELLTLEALREATAPVAPIDKDVPSPSRAPTVITPELVINEAPSSAF